MTSRERLAAFVIFTAVGCAEGVADPLGDDDASPSAPTDSSSEHVDAARQRDALARDEASAGEASAGEDAAPDAAPADATAPSDAAPSVDGAPDAAPDATADTGVTSGDGGAVCNDTAHVNQLVILLGAHATIASCPFAAGQCCTAFGTVQGCVPQ